MHLYSQMVLFAFEIVVFGSHSKRRIMTFPVLARSEQDAIQRAEQRVINEGFLLRNIIITAELREE